jgi:hypothetical protein
MRTISDQIDVKRTVADAPVRGKNARRPYEAPRVTVYTQEEILAGIGPARAIYGNPGGNP